RRKPAPDSRAQESLYPAASRTGRANLYAQEKTPLAPDRGGPAAGKTASRYCTECAGQTGRTPPLLGARELLVLPGTESDCIRFQPHSTSHPSSSPSGEF